MSLALIACVALLLAYGWIWHDRSARKP